MLRLDRLRIMVLVPDADSRSTLRDALAAVVFKGDVHTLRRFEDARALLNGEEAFDVIFFASSFGIDEVKLFIREVASLPKAPDTAMVLTVDRHTSNKLESVVSSYLDGVDGFISEPYTSEQLQDLLMKILDPARERAIQTATRVIKSVNLLATQAVTLVDEMWRFRMDGGKGSGSALGEMKRISPSLQELQSKHPVEFLTGLSDVFEAVEPPSTESLSTKSKVRTKKAEHPGKFVQTLMEQRGLTRERLLASVRISPEEFDAVLSCQMGLNDAVAREFARVLGKTAREWMSMQRAFDLANPKNAGDS